ncbi:hypothetical protein APHAL10511_006672 [Amanita phalloides]|nr:hypothetical protein APHAL10511_006672 [Amanita phalloides]
MFFNVNKPAAGVPYFTPSQIPPAGTASPPQPDDPPLPKLFQPLKIRNVELHNRIWLSPLCQYSSENGVVTEWQHAHLGGIFTRGPGLSIVEASAILPEGRITPEDAGIWDDTQAKAWSEIVQFAHSQNQKIAIQIGHAGRGWPDNVYGPSAVAFDESYPRPKALTKEGIKRIVAAFASAAIRAVKADFDIIEIHNAHARILAPFIPKSRE